MFNIKIMDASFEGDHYPEVVESGKANKRIERLGLKEELVDSDRRRTYFRSLTDEQYKKTLGYISSLTKGEPIRYDYQDGQLPLEPTPPLEDKERLMNLTFQTVRNILSDEKLDSTQALRTAGLTLAGATSYIHPYENGNGRTGRVMHYIIEFGNQRGEQALEEELYAIIGKLPHYDTDKAKALDNSLPPELGEELNHFVDNYGEDFSDDKVRASRRVEAFLSMMQGKLNVPINREISMRNFSLAQEGGSPVVLEKIPAGQLNGKELYERQYLYSSSIPHRKPNEAPQGAKRVLGESRPLVDPKNLINLEIDLV